MQIVYNHFKIHHPRTCQPPSRSTAISKETGNDISTEGLKLLPQPPRWEVRPQPPPPTPWPGSKQPLNPVSRVQFLPRPARKTLRGWSCNSKGAEGSRVQLPPYFPGGRREAPSVQPPWKPLLVVWRYGNLPRLLCRAQATGKCPTTFWG